MNAAVKTTLSLPRSFFQHYKTVGKKMDSGEPSPGLKSTSDEVRQGKTVHTVCPKRMFCHVTLKSSKNKDQAAPCD